MEPTAGRRATRVATPPNVDVSGGDTAVRWVPITELTELARALLGERPSGRDVVPIQVAERISRLAAQWATHGFTAATVRPWADLQPAAAAVLTAAGATPEALDRHVVTTGGTTTTLWRAVSSGAMSAEDAAAAFKPGATPAPAGGTFSGGPSSRAEEPPGTPGQSRGASRNAFSASAPETPVAYKAASGAARPAADTFKAPPLPAAADEVEETAARAKVAPAVFSHPAAETAADVDDRRRRSAPPQTPFST